MTQPEGFISPKDIGKTCKLRLSIYGLKQASRRWNIHFEETIKEFDFIQSGDEPCVYRRLVGTMWHSWYYMLTIYYL